MVEIEKKKKKKKGKREKGKGKESKEKGKKRKEPIGFPSTDDSSKDGIYRTEKQSSSTQ